MPQPLLYVPLPTRAPSGRSGGAGRRLLWLLGLVALVAGGGVAMCGAMVKEAVSQAVAGDRARAEANRRSCGGWTYPDRRPDDDRCADAGAAVVLDDVRITASPVAAADGRLCTDVTYINNTGHTIGVSESDWKLRTPGGAVLGVRDSTLSANGLGSADVLAGASKHGTMCFDAAGRGRYVLIHKPHRWNDDRAVWVSDV